MSIVGLAFIYLYYRIVNHWLILKNLGHHEETPWTPPRHWDSKSRHGSGHCSKLEPFWTLLQAGPSSPTNAEILEMELVENCWNWCLKLIEQCWKWLKNVENGCKIVENPKENAEGRDLNHVHSRSVHQRAKQLLAKISSECGGSNCLPENPLWLLLHLLPPSYG